VQPKSGIMSLLAQKQPKAPKGAKGALGAVSIITGDPKVVWKSLDKFNNPHAGDWANTEVLLHRLKHEVRFNAWTERSEIREAGGIWVARQDWHLDKLARIGSSDPHNYRPAESTFRRAIDSLARESTVDPARDLLVKLQGEWDGQARLHSWLSYACGVPYDAYHQAVGQCILLGLVARIRRPGVKFDLMPVLVSEVQGTSKSTLAQMLALDDDWFTAGVRLGDAEKELVLSLAGKSVAEISEMRTRGEVDAVKAMISATHDEGRPAYGRSIVKRPRRNIFVGTTNRPEFLEDPSGGRRFLPIVVQGEINLDFVRQQLPQLIGEAATLQSRGADINLPRELWATAAEHQLAATAKSSAEVLLSDWFAGEAPCWISSGNLVLLLRVALGREVSRGAYAPVMANLGFVNKTRRVGESVPRVWVRGEPGKAMGYGPSLSPSGRPMLQVQHLPEPKA
jgi:predicted P-loop ATPase